MTAGIVDVEAFAIWIDVGDDDIFVAISCQTDAQLEINRDLKEIMCKLTGDGVDYSYSTLRWSVSGSFNFAFDDTLGGFWFVEKLIAKEKFEIQIGTATVGDKVLKGTGLIQNPNVSSSGGKGEHVTASMTIQGEGVPTVVAVV